MLVVGRIIYPDLPTNITDGDRHRWQAIWAGASICFFVVTFVNLAFFSFLASVCIPQSCCKGGAVCRTSECIFLVKKRICDRGLRFVVSLQLVSLTTLSMAGAVFISPDTPPAQPWCQIQGFLVEMSLIWKFSLLMLIAFWVVVAALLQNIPRCRLFIDKCHRRVGSSPSDPRHGVVSSLQHESIVEAGAGDDFDETSTPEAPVDLFAMASDRSSDEDEVGTIDLLDDALLVDDFDDIGECQFSPGCCIELVLEGGMQVGSCLLAVGVAWSAYFSNLYKLAGYWCWLPEPIPEVSYLYGPSWTSWVFVFLFYIVLFFVNVYQRCHKEARRRFGHGGGYRNVELSAGEENAMQYCAACKDSCVEFLKTAIFVLSPVLIWMWPSLFRIVYWATKKESFPLQLMTITFLPAFGVVNFVTFLTWMASTYRVRESQDVKDSCLLAWFCKKKP